jgi:transketolase
MIHLLRLPQALATRAHSQTMLNVLQPVLPGLIGGSADLAPSNLTIMKVSTLDS